MAKPAFKPLFDRVLIETYPAQKKIGLIHVPDSAEEKPMLGRVVECGPGYPRNDGTVRPMSVEPGQEVMYERFAGTPIELGLKDGEGKIVEFVIVKEEDIMGVVNG